MMDILTILPRLRFADTNGKFDQIEYIKGELKELADAYLSEPIERVAEEAGDVLMAAWTLLWVIHRDTGIHPIDVMTRVITKNKKRGYENGTNYSNRYIPEDRLTVGVGELPFD